MDVTVPGFQLFEEGAVLNATPANIVGETCQKQAVSTVSTIVSAEPGQIFPQYPVGFSMGILSFSVVFALLNYMTVSYCRPMFRFVECFIIPDQDTGPFKRW